MIKLRNMLGNPKFNIVNTIRTYQQEGMNLEKNILIHSSYIYIGFEE